MRKFISILALLFVFVTTAGYSQVADEKKKELLSLHAVTKYCRYNNGNIIPQGGSSLSISLTGLNGAWPGGPSLAAPDTVPLPNLFNDFDSVIPFPDYHRDWFYPSGEVDPGKQLLAEKWRNNRQALATGEYVKRSDGFQRSRIEHMRTWVTANEPVPYERKRLLRATTKLTVDGTSLAPQERIIAATIPAKDIHSSSLDLKPGSLWVKVNGVSVERPFNESYKETIDLSLLPFEVVSRDKFLAGSIVIPDGWDSLQMEFRGPNDEDFGKHGDFFAETGSPETTKIYPKVEDILGETDETGQSQDQKVWFARNPSDPRKIDFYTCFNSIGETRIKFYLNGDAEPVGEIAHLLKTDAGMADWIAYADAWVKGTSFPWVPMNPGDPLAMRMGGAGFSAMSSLSEELDNYTRAALIPVFLAVESVEGMRAFLYGLLEGVKQGALDDWELIVAIGKGAAASIDWVVSESSFRFHMMIANPRESAHLFVDIAKAAAEKFVFAPMQQAGEELKKTFSSWENLKNSAFRMWDHVYNTGVQIYIVGGNLAGSISDSIEGWLDSFSSRMMAGADKASFDNTPWEDDVFFAGADSAITAINYATGYTIGYICEQILAGKGSAAVGKLLTRGAALVVGKIATRTTFAVGTRLHKAKKKLQGIAGAIEMNAALERGLAKTGRGTLDDLANRTVISESYENTLRELGEARARFNLKDVVDELSSYPKLKELQVTAGRESLLMHRTAQLGHLLGGECDDVILKNFKKVADEAIVTRGADGSLDEFFEAFFRSFTGNPSQLAHADDPFYSMFELSANGKAALKKFLSDPPGQFWDTFDESTFFNNRARGVLGELAIYKRSYKARGYTHAPNAAGYDFYSALEYVQIKTTKSPQSAYSMLKKAVDDLEARSPKDKKLLLHLLVKEENTLTAQLKTQVDAYINSLPAAAKSRFAPLKIEVFEFMP